MKQNIILIRLVFGFVLLSSFACKSQTEPQVLPENVPAEGLIGWWPLDGNADDLSPNNNNGELNDLKPTINRYSEAGKALLFDGRSSYIVVPNSPSLNPTSFSISGWYNSDSEAKDAYEGSMGIFTKWFQTVDCEYFGDNYNVQLSRINSKNCLIGVTSKQNKSVGAITVISETIQPLRWVHFVMIHDAIRGQKIYINGSLVQEKALTGKLCYTTNDVYFGVDSYYGNLWRFFSGKLDDFGMWDRPLSNSEVKALYEPILKVVIDVEDCSQSYMYPNPFISTVTLRADSCNIGSRYTLFDSIGKKVEEGVVMEKMTKFDFSNYPGGFYALKVDEKNPITFKLAKAE